MTTDAVAVLGYARTPFGAFGRSLRDWPIPRLGAIAVREAMRRAGIEGQQVDECVIGTNLPGADRSIARQTSLHSGIPDHRPSYTVDQACCSSLAAITVGSRGLRIGDTDLVVAGGADNLSRVPYFLEDARWGHRLGNVTMTDQLVVTCPYTGVARAVQAGEEAVSWGVSRNEQDQWAVRSQERFADAVRQGHHDHEIVPVRPDEPAGLSGLDADECPRPQTTLEALAELPTVYGSPTVTAGTAPALSSGAGALVLARPGWAPSGASPAVASLSGWAMVSGAPERIASIPATAAGMALERVGLRLADMHVIEINEAFAAVPLVTTLALADKDHRRAEELRSRTNVNGGAIAVGHPTGATGARLVMTAIGELRRRGGGRALVTMCGGIGEAAALVVTVSGN